MAGRVPTSERNLGGYGAPAIEWTLVRDVLDGELTQAPGTGGPGRHTAWLSTGNPDGSPHVRPLGVKVAGDALTAEFSAPSAGPPPWHVYRVIPSRVYAFGTAEPYGAGRFDLTSPQPPTPRPGAGTG